MDSYDQSMLLLSNKTRPFLSFVCASPVPLCHPFRRSGRYRNLAHRLTCDQSAGRGREREETSTRKERLQPRVDKKSNDDQRENSPVFLLKTVLPHQASAVMIWLALLAQSFITK